MSPKHSVLVVDDEEFVRESLVDLLENEGYETFTAGSAPEALKVLEGRDVSAVVTDLRMPEGDGLMLLEETRKRRMDLPVILLTGVGTVEDAVRAMKGGAYDFIQKPVDPQQFVHLVQRAIEHLELLSEVNYLRHAVEDLRGPTEMVGSSPALARVRELIDRVAPTDATVLITGESGTGKELVAAEIHARSPRAGANFVSVNCAAIPETLFESEFFGHRRGAFTSATSDRVGRCAEAEGGTLALDEIGTLRPEMQAKLLRVLETGEYQVVGESRTRKGNVRVLAITNEDLAARVRDGAFRPDLFYRLNVFPIEVPPLRERRTDIPELAGYFAARARPGAGPSSAVSAAAAEILQEYEWPGNVRELRNVVERVVILAGKGDITPALLRSVLGDPRRAVEPAVSDQDLRLKRRVENLEKSLIREALSRVGGKKREAAELLGLDPKNLAYYLRKHEIQDGSPRAEEGSQE